MNKITRWILSALLVVSLFAYPITDNNSYAKTAYQKTALTGGTATSLDGIDGSSLSDGDFAYVMMSDVFYTYVLNASSGASESTPDVVSPDSNAGTKRWILQKTPIQGGGTGQATAAAAFSALKQSATESATGVAELATTAEAIAGTDTSRIVTPAGLAAAQAVISNPKAPSQGVAMTYAASGSTGIQAATDDDLNMATNNFGFACMDALPDITPSADVILAQKHDGSNGWIFKVLTTGYLRLTINATNYDSTATLASIGCIDTGRMFPHFSVTRESASVAGSVVFGVSGVQLGASVAITAGAPTTVSNTSTMYILGGSTVRYAGITSFNGLTNFAPTIAEWLEVFRLGTVPESWKWGSQTSLVTGDNSTFASDTGWWTKGAGASIADGVAHFSSVTVDKAGLRKNSILSANKRYLVVFTVKNYVAGAVQCEIGGGGGIYRSADGTYTQEILNTSSVDTNLYFTARNATTTLDIDDITIIPIGATFALEPEGIQPAPGQWLDSSSNKLHAMQPATGSSLIRYKKEFEFRSTNVWTASSAAQYIGGFNQNVLTSKHMITSIVSRMTVSTDDENITIGDGSDADYYVTDVAPTAAPLIHTLAKNLNDGTNLKLVVTPAAEATMTIEFIVKGVILE